MMMKQQYGQQQQQQPHQQQMQQQHQQHSMNGSGGGGSQQGGNASPPLLNETKWWYKGPDGETYGPYSPKEMHTWNDMGYFSEGLLVRTENDVQFHPYGDWLIVMRGASPFTSPTVPAFVALVQSHQQAAAAAAQFHLYPPGLPAPASTNGSSNGGGGGAPSGPGRFSGPPPPSQPQQPGAYGQPPAAAAATFEAMARLHMGGAGDARMGMMGPMHMGGPLSQPPSEPTDGPPHSQSPDNNEPDFRSLHHHVNGPPPPSMAPTILQYPAAVAAAQAAAAARMQFGYGMPPMQQQPQPQQSIAPLQQSQPHGMGGPTGVGSAGAPLTHASNGQLQYSRVTSTADAPWNSRREMAVDATQRAAPRATIATQTLPVIIGSKDASRLLSDLTGCSIVIT